MRSIFAFFADLLRIFHSRLFIITIVLTFAVRAYCDSKSIARQEIPVELRASDPEIKGLIDTAADKRGVSTTLRHMISEFTEGTKRSG